MEGVRRRMSEKLHYIEFRHVYKTFDHPVLVDMNFDVAAGETLAIIGRSGVGKSVSLGHIMGFIKPDQGQVFVSYQDTTDFAEAQLREIRKKVTMVDLLHFRDAYPTDLSTGYKRAVAIARALAAQPECILYDEPTTMVDPIMSDHVGNLMLRLKRQLKLTGVVVTHDLELMRKVADTVVVLHEGKAIYFGPVADLEKSEHPHIKEFLAMDRIAMVGENA